MKTLSMRGLLLAAAMLAALAVAAIPAGATLSPTGANSATSIDFTFTSGATRVRCPRADFRGTFAADGLSLNGTVTFDRTATVTCTESLLGSSVTITCIGTTTYRSVTSVRGVAASGDMSLDNGFSCTIRSLAPNRGFSGIQTIRGCVTWRQGPPSRMAVECIITDSTGTPAVYSLTYTFATAIRIA